MSDSKLNRLKNLIKSLRAEEQTLAKKHLSAYESYHTRKSSRMLELYKVILKEPDIQYERLKKIVSSDSTKKSFNQLIGRTISRIKESMILDINILREGNYSKVFQKRFLVRKQIVQCQILRGRGLINETLLSYNSIIKSAKKYELYDELIEVLQMKQSALVSSKGAVAFDEMKKEIDYYSRCRELFTEAKNVYNQYHAKVNFSSSKRLDTVLLRNTIKKIEKFAQESESINILCMSYILKMDYYSDKRMYEHNHETGKKFLYLLKNEPAVISRNRQAFILNSLIENQILDLRFDSALDYAQESMKLLSRSKSRNLYEVMEFKTYTHFYMGDFEKVEKTLSQMEDFSFLKKEVYKRTKLYFVRSMKYFAQERFREANLLLSNMAELEKEKEGWNVWIRIMRILCSIEMLKLNLIDYDIENFRKFMERTEKRMDVKPRDKLALKVLIELDRSNFDFREVALKRAKELKQLRSTKGKFKWTPLSPEMILFHDWFQSKVKEERYKPDFDNYRSTSAQNV